MLAVRIAIVKRAIKREGNLKGVSNETNTRSDTNVHSLKCHGHGLILKVVKRININKVPSLDGLGS